MSRSPAELEATTNHTLTPYSTRRRPHPTTRCRRRHRRHHPATVTPYSRSSRPPPPTAGVARCVQPRWSRLLPPPSASAAWPWPDLGRDTRSSHGVTRSGRGGSGSTATMSEAASGFPTSTSSRPPPPSPTCRRWRVVGFLAPSPPSRLTTWFPRRRGVVEADS